MKEFDFEAAKRGAAVMTLHGHRAKILCFDKKGELPIVAIIDFENYEKVYDYSENGSMPFPTPSRLFLAMRDDDYLERLEQGEYHTEEKTEMIDPTIKKSLQVGLSRREEFVKAAMQGLCAKMGVDIVPEMLKQQVREAVLIADATIAALD